MAIDTVAKKLSLISYSVIGLSLPPSDGIIDNGDKAHLLGLYSGIEIGSGEYIRVNTKSIRFKNIKNVVSIYAKDHDSVNSVTVRGRSTKKSVRF